MPQRNHRPSRSRSFRVGSHVLFRVGSQEFKAEVIEDRGHIGKDGRHLLRIKLIDTSAADPDSTFELPAEQLMPAT